MELTVLVGNNGLPIWHTEWGLSFLIEDGPTKILFDLGPSDLFLRNSLQLNCNLLDLDYVAVSHGHWDHSWGIGPLIESYTKAEIIKEKRPILVAHPLTFAPKIRLDQFEVGTLISEDVLIRNFSITLTKKPFWLTEKLVFLGEIERKYHFENKAPKDKLITGGVLADDYLWDDTALAYKCREGLVIITGCSHSGICNIVEYAKQVCHENRIVDIIGGFHLLNPSATQMQGTVDYFKELQPLEVHACHCTDLNAKLALSTVSNMKEVGVGLKITYN
jgi:7,8-dihydropterin-6-yl-methyl-4-(beta-D-ribofuranosyl)aminobenzene 5'-phosphate synthase